MSFFGFIFRKLQSACQRMREIGRRVLRYAPVALDGVGTLANRAVVTSAGVTAVFFASSAAGVALSPVLLSAAVVIGVIFPDFFSMALAATLGDDEVAAALRSQM